MTQKGVADAVGISVHFYAHIERGRQLPSMNTFVELLAFYELRPSAALGDTRAACPDAAARVEGAPVNGGWGLLVRRLRRADPGVLALVEEVLDGLVPEEDDPRAGSARSDSRPATRGRASG